MDEIKKEKFPTSKFIGMFIEKDTRTFKNPDEFLQMLQKVLAFANENDISIPGHHVAIYESKPDSLSLRLFIGYPVSEKVVIVNSQFAILEIEESSALTIMHKGNHSALPGVHKHMHDAIVKTGVYINKFIIEEYLRYTTTEPDSDKWETKISYLTTAVRPTGKDRKHEKKKASILILEDEDMLCDALSMFLIEYGFEVVVAKNGNEAEEIVAQRSFDLALLDLLVPGVSGFEIFKALRKKQTNIPIFILSNLEEEENKKEAEKLGASKYFVKSETLLSEVAKEIADVFAK